MKSNIKRACLLLTSTLLLAGCSNQESLDRDAAKAKFDEVYTAYSESGEPSVYSFQLLSRTVDENDEVVESLTAISIDTENKSLYLSSGDVVAKGYNPVEQEEESEEESEIDFSNYTFDYSLDGGETFLEEPLVGEEALAKYDEYALQANVFMVGTLVVEGLYVTSIFSELSSLEETLPEKEELEEGDMSLDLHELYYEEGDEFHIGISYEYGPLKVDEEDEESLLIDTESESYKANALALHFLTYEEVMYPSHFESEDLVSTLTLGSLLYESEIFPEEE